MTRREFMLKAQKDRFDWVKRTDSDALAKFDVATKARTTNGIRKRKTA